MELDRYLGLWKQTLSGPGPNGAVATELGFELPRLRLYRKLVHSHYRGAVEKMYPLLKRQAPELFHSEIIEGYFAAHPPTAWELNDLARDFPKYLKSQTHYPTWYAEVAEYEWAQFITYLHPADENEIRSNLKADEVALNPTLYIMQLQHQIHEWAQALDATLEKTGAKPQVPTVAVSVEGTLENTGVSVGPEAISQVLLVGRTTEPFSTSIVEPALLGLVVVQSLSEGPKSRHDCAHSVAERMQVSDDLVLSEIETLTEWSVLLSPAMPR
jgi:hypothetical protein